MDKQIEILMRQGKQNAERLDNIVRQLDTDRKDIDNLMIDQETIKEQQKKILDNLLDFKAEIRQMVKDTVSSSVQDSVKTAVAKEMRKLSLNHPKRVFVIYYGLADLVKRGLNKLLIRKANG